MVSLHRRIKIEAIAGKAFVDAVETIADADYLAEYIKSLTEQWNMERKACSAASGPPREYAYTKE